MKRLLLTIVLLLLFAASGFAQVSFDQASTTDTYADGGTGSANHTNLTISGGCANPVILAFLGTSFTPGASASVTWNPGGQNLALTQIATAATPTEGYVIRIYGAVGPVTGNQTLNFNWNNAGGGDVYMAAASFCNVDQGGGASSWTGFTNTGTNNQPTITFASTSTGYTVAATNAPQSFSAFPHTQIFENDDDGGATGAAAARLAGTGSNVTYTWTMGGSVNWSTVGVNLIAASAGGSTGHINLLLRGIGD